MRELIIALLNPLCQRIAEGLAESEAWRLFQQIVDALAHMSSLNIVRSGYHLFKRRDAETATDPS